VSITTNVVSSNPSDCELYSIQHYMIKSLSVASDRSVIYSGYSGFLTNTTDFHDTTEILLKVKLNSISISLYVAIFFLGFVLLDL